MAAILPDDNFKCILLNKNDKMPIPISLKFIPMSPIDSKPAFGSGNGLAPKRRQAVPWTTVNPVHWRIYAALGGGVNTIPADDPGPGIARPLVTMIFAMYMQSIVFSESGFPPEYSE